MVLLYSPTKTIKKTSILDCIYHTIFINVFAVDIEALHVCARARKSMSAMSFSVTACTTEIRN